MKNQRRKKEKRSARSSRCGERRAMIQPDDKTRSPLLRRCKLRHIRVLAAGFFSTGNDVTPGNYGLKDVAAGLLWLKRNARTFGGDPDSVTLFGQSSGAATAQILSASPATEGLIHKVSLINSLLCFWSRNVNHARLTFRLVTVYFSSTLRLIILNPLLVHLSLTRSRN